MIQERAFWVAWSSLPGVGPILLRRLHLHFGSLATAWGASAGDLAAVEGIGFNTADAIARGRSRLDPHQVLEQHLKANPDFWTPADPDYPRLLLEIPDPPPVLYYRGQPNLAENQGLTAAIALVGTRNPSDYGRRWTQRIAQALALAGFTVVSGLAEGIDTEAHRRCLDCNSRTIAVLGTGVDIIYPWSNRRLAHQIIDQGLLVSEYPSGTQPDRAHFPRRNRIIAGLCRATLVLEAPTKSGALITARLANDYGRDVYALPGSLDHPTMSGCLQLLEKGAGMILGEAHLLDTLKTLPVFSISASRLDASVPEQLSILSNPPLDLAPELEQVFNVIGLEPLALDSIVLNSGLPTASVSSALLQLELMGLVSQLPGMLYRRG